MPYLLAFVAEGFRHIYVLYYMLSLCKVIPNQKHSSVSQKKMFPQKNIKYPLQSVPTINVRKYLMILWMEEILHQLVDGLSMFIPLSQVPSRRWLPCSLPNLRSRPHCNTWEKKSEIVMRELQWFMCFYYNLRLDTQKYVISNIKTHM